MNFLRGVTFEENPLVEKYSYYKVSLLKEHRSKHKHSLRLVSELILTSIEAIYFG